MNKLEAYIEAERRGILPPDKAGLLQEARKRGLVGGQQNQEPGFAERVGEQKQVSKPQAFARGLEETASFGLTDELRGFGRAAGTKLRGDERSFTELLSRGIQEVRDEYTRSQEQQPGATFAGEAVGAIAPAFTPGGQAIAARLGAGGLKSGLAKGAGSGAAALGAYGFGSGEGNIIDRLPRTAGFAAGGAVTGGGGVAVGRGVTALASKAKEAARPIADKAVAPLAKRAEQFGIPLRIDQVAPSRFKNTVQKVTQEIPGSGADAFEDTQRQAFTKAVAKTIGQEADDLGPDTVNRFLDENSAVFSRLVGESPVKVDAEDVKQISALRSTVDKTTGITSRDAKILKTEIDAISKQLSGGEVSGSLLASVRSDLLKKSTGASVGKEIFSNLIEKIDDITKNSLTDAGRAELATARRQYRNFKTIEPLLEESTDGLINPTKLMSRVKSSKYIKASRAAVGDDDLVDLARIGKEFLPVKGGSDTFQKSALTLGATATPGALYGLVSGDDPVGKLTSAAIYGLAPIAAARAYQKYATSPKVVGKALSRVENKSNPLLGLVR